VLCGAPLYHAPCFADPSTRRCLILPGVITLPPYFYMTVAVLLPPPLLLTTGVESPGLDSLLVGHTHHAHWRAARAGGGAPQADSRRADPAPQATTDRRAVPV